MTNFNSVIILLDVPYNKRDTAKKYGARWSPDRKKWYCVHNINKIYFDCDKQCFGNIRLICIFDIVEIIHTYLEGGGRPQNCFITT